MPTTHRLGCPGEHFVLRRLAFGTIHPFVRIHEILTKISVSLSLSLKRSVTMLQSGVTCAAATIRDCTGMRVQHVNGKAKNTEEKT